jgi:hypothetical protein
VVQAPGRVLERATVVVRDGLIEAVGPDVAVPYDARRLAADSLTVYAGFIDGLSHAGVQTPAPPEGPENDGPASIDPGAPPPDTAGLQPDRTVRPLLSPTDTTLKALRRLGFTAGHVTPDGQMLPGQGAYILYGGETPHDMVLDPAPTLAAQIAPAPNPVYPATEMAVIAKFRQLYREAERRQQLRAEYDRNRTGAPRPPSDPLHEAFRPVLAGDQPLAFWADDALSLHRVLDLQAELGAPLLLAGLGESFRLVDALQAVDAPLFLTLALPAPPERPADADTTVADTTDDPGRYYDPNLRTASYREVDEEETNLRLRHAVERTRYRQTAATLQEAGVDFGFASREASPDKIRPHLRTMIEHGLPRNAALAALTTRPAALLGLDDRLGTVESGKIANLVVTDGPYFDEDTAVRYVFVDGRLYEYSESTPADDTAGDASAVVGTWAYTINAPQGTRTGTLTLNADASGLDGTLEPNTGPSRALESVSFEGTTLSFVVDVPDGPLSISVTVTRNTFGGTASAGEQTSSITGTRTDAPDGR